MNGEFTKCVHRQKVVTVAADGHKEQQQRCKCRASIFFGLSILPSDCEICPHKQPESVLEQRKKQVLSEHPPEAAASPHPYGTVRAISDTVELSPSWQACGDRERLTIVKPCGRSRVARWCNSIAYDNIKAQTEISKSDCQDCPFRRVPPILEPENQK